MFSCYLLLQLSDMDIVFTQLGLFMNFNEFNELKKHFKLFIIHEV